MKKIVKMAIANLMMSQASGAHSLVARILPF